MLTFTLSWVLPTTRADGSPLAPTDISAVVITDSQNASTPTTLPGTATSFTTVDLSAQPGAHAFSVVVLDNSSPPLASAPDVVTGSVPQPTTAAPSPVSGLTITTNQS